MKYFWVDLIDEVSDGFKEDVYFEDAIERYKRDNTHLLVFPSAILVSLNAVSNSLDSGHSFVRQRFFFR